MKYKILSLFSFLILFIFLVSCRESISEPTTEKIVDEKPMVVSLKEIQTPSERVIWEQGKEYEIQWSVTQNLDKISIVLLKKFVQVATIAGSTENDGSYNWFIPVDLPASHHYRIKIISPYNYLASSTSVEFEIENLSGIPLDDK